MPECTQCGACCFSTLERYVPVSGADHARFGEDAERWVNFDGYSAHLRMQDGHCSALVMTLVTNASEGVDAAPNDTEVVPRFTCATYETRPETCRTLERGGPMCRAERELKATRALISVGALTKHRR